MRRSHWRPALTLLLSFSAGGPARAEEPPPPDSAARAEVKGPLAVNVEIEGYVLDPTDVQLAVARELGVAVTPSPEAARGTVRVLAKKGAELSVVYQPEGRPALMRSVAAPARDDEVAEAAALLIGNLARDESSELIASLTPAKQPEKPPEPKPAPPDAPAKVAARPYGPVNLSLFHPLTVVPRAHEKRFAVEFGLFYSRVGAVDALSLNPFVLAVEGPAQGLQVAGIASYHGEGGTGLRVAGIGAYDQGDFNGAAVTGVVRVKRGNDRGLGVVGVATHQEGKFRGLLVSGVTSVTSGPFSGGQVSGVAGVAWDSFSGAQISGVANVVRGDVSGAQISGVANVVRGDVSGAQIGLVNIGGRVEGLQLGLVNVADEIDGASIGLVTLSKSGRVQPTVWYGSAGSPANVGLRFYTGPLYAMPTLGFDTAPDSADPDGPDVATFTPGVSLGARIPIGRAFVDVEGNYGNRAPEFRFDEHTIDLHYRAWVGFEVTPWFAPMVGGGVRHLLHTEGRFEEQYEPELCLGLQFL